MVQQQGHVCRVIRILEVMLDGEMIIGRRNWDIEVSKLLLISETITLRMKIILQ